MKSKVKEYRQKLEITQQELGDKAGVARQTINSLENGKYNPSLILAYKITSILGLDNIHDLFTFEKEDLEEE
ncbi:helix-turn-helix transcriptional regulator [Methanobrevibacter sp. DSM 116169]|uniref:helix-turn-helix transcriptional regulator n=1 Tax=Methanobrevibacter sp. DSM 116169 TaxID=3242727 RepID=UPI0038FC6A3B